MVSEVLDLAEICCEHEQRCLDPAGTVFSSQISVFQVIHMNLVSGVLKIQHGGDFPIEVNENVLELWTSISVHSKCISSQKTLYLCNINTSLNATLVILHFQTIYHIYISWKG